MAPRPGTPARRRGFRSTRPRARRHRNRTPDPAPPPCPPATAARCLGSRLGIAVVTLACAMLPSTRKPVSVSRRAPRCLCSSSRTSFGDQPLERLGRGLGMRRRFLEPSVARGGGSLGAAVSGSSLRPSIRSSTSITSVRPRNRRASASRGISISAPMVLSPSRSSVRTVSGSRRRAASERGGQFEYRLSVSRQRPGRRRGRGDRDTRRETRCARNAPRCRDQPRLAAEQMCDSADVEPRASSPSTSTSGDQRPVHCASRSISAASPAGSAGMATSAGSSARASVSRAPGRAPRSAAALVTAWMIGPCVPSTVRTTGEFRQTVARLRPALDRQMRQPDGSDPLHAARLHRPGGCPRARNSSASHAASPGARGSSGLTRLGALAIRHRIRAPLKLAVPPSRTSQHGVPAAFRRDRQPPRRGEIERSRIAPQFADHG